MSRGLLAVAFAAMVATSALGATARGDWRSDDYAERDEFTQSYTLAPGAVVTVNDISGPVEIETWDGETAEVRVVRSAPSREELEKKKIVVEQTAGGLRIGTEKRPRGMNWDRSHVRQSVSLRLPYRVSLAVSDVAGSLQVGRIDGDVRVNDIAGAVKIESANGSPRISDIAGRLEVAIDALGPEGINISDIAGKVDLRIGSVTDADIEIDDVSGQIDVDAPAAVVVGKIDPERYRGRIGAGGPRIAISDIAGGVTVRTQ